MPISFTRATWTDYVGPPFMQASEANRLETAIDALINGSSRAVYRDGDTMTGNLTTNGWIEADQGYRDAAGVTRVSSTGAGAFSTLSSANLTDTHVLVAGASGAVQGSSFLTYLSSGRLIVGSGIGSAPMFVLNATSGSNRMFRMESVGSVRWQMGAIGQTETGSDVGSGWRLEAYTDAGALIDYPIVIARVSGGDMTLGGSTSRLIQIAAGSKFGYSSTLNFRRSGDGTAMHFATGNTGTNALLPDTSTTANNPFLGVAGFRWQGLYAGLVDSSGLVNAATSLQTSGVTRISSTGAGTLASVTVADLTANLPVYADASKKLATESASAFRSRISAQAQDAKLDAISAGETAARVWAAKYNATVGGYSVSSIDGRLRFGNGVWLYLAAGSTTLLKSTDDGATWSTITPGATFYDLCWHSAASLWVAVGTNICYTSPDGTTWTTRTIPAGSWRACASNGTTVIAGSVTCTVAYSTNATSWTSATTPSGVPAAGFYAACWSATIGKFLLIGSGNASTSTTGTGSWTAITNPSCTPYWCGDLGGRFVAVDLSTGPSYSTDGGTWSSPRRTPSAKSSFVGFASSGVVGFIGGATEETQAISTDGETWMPVDFGYTGSFNGVGYGNGWFLALDSLGFVYRSRG
jgi:hypothetical protein